MEAVIGNLSKEEFFGSGPNYSENQNPGVGRNSNNIGKVVFWMIIGGVIVYIFRDDIEALFLMLLGNSLDESEKSP